MRRNLITVTFLLINFIITGTEFESKLIGIKLPAGFKISVFAENIISAREISISPSGIIFVGSMKGNVYAIIKDDKTDKAKKIYVIAKDLIMPVGVCYHNNDLYISEVNKVIKLENIESRLTNPPAPVTVNDSFPADTWHGWKFIKFGPDNKLYVPQGMPCNICEAPDKRYGTISRMNADGSELEIFANGIRNSVGFDWNPATKELWFTDNGADYMGDNIPPDELDYAPVKGNELRFSLHS